ncbi:MAG: hypothetical protein JJ971_12230 [Balneolaceae bacterium]|nr:hypothetical protein [Balneolaceae bacterium]MBO6547381.1 hypothetical protein [Balneolaceae bacterium]MBO6647672.1 hypothetical protein [Balneolaceae bacterium]
MHYPIFKSIVNTVDTQLDKRGISSRKFKTWEDNKINAIGLELIIDLENTSDFMKSLSINFDWDSFRETTVARQLTGMEEHPFLKIERLSKTPVSPTIDIEMAWLFDIDVCQPEAPDKEGNYRIEQASKWMEGISQEINTLLKDDNVITRWHIEIEGDEKGKYLSAINLISYFQYELSAPSTVNEINTLVSKSMQELLLKASRVIHRCDDVLKETVAA